MLILMRRVGERIFVGDDIIITVVGFERGRVRIGVSAPQTLEVHREEVYERVLEERRSAAP
jgi:carbon storage regulator